MLDLGTPKNDNTPLGNADTPGGINQTNAVAQQAINPKLLRQYK